MNLHLTDSELNLLKEHAPALHAEVVAHNLVENNHTAAYEYFIYDVPVALWNEALDRIEAIEAEQEA